MNYGIDNFYGRLSPPLNYGEGKKVAHVLWIFQDSYQEINR